MANLQTKQARTKVTWVTILFFASILMLVVALVVSWRVALHEALMLRFTTLMLVALTTMLLCVAIGTIALTVYQQKKSEREAGRKDSPQFSGQWEAVELAPLPILQITGGGRVVASNQKARALLALSISEETYVTDLFEGLGRPILDWVSDVSQNRIPPKPEFLTLRGTQEKRIVQVTPSVCSRGSPPDVIAVLNEVTEVRSLERQFLQSQKMQAVSQLAGGIAHDFNNLLTTILGQCEIVLARNDCSDQSRMDIATIHQTAERAAALVGNLLAFSRKQTLSPKMLDMETLLMDLSTLLNRLVETDVTVTLDCERNLKQVLADPQQLNQVLVNLAINASDATPSGGTIRIEARNVILNRPLERDDARVPAGTYVCMSLADTGTGMSEEIRHKVFEPFFSTKISPQSTGLGLSMAYGIIKQTGGYIFADSAPGQGAKFTIYLPCNGPVISKALAQNGNLIAAEAISSRKILLAEDEAAVRNFAARALKMCGYEVLEADCGEAALRCLEEVGGAVEAVISDVIMPGLDGPAWVLQAMKSYPGLKVIFVSGYAEETFSTARGKIPGSKFLPKPFSLSALTSTVDDLVATRPPNPGC